MPGNSFFGVFDGHGGVDAANYAASHTCCNVVRQKTFNNNLENALKQGFLQTDKNFIQKAKADVRLVCIVLVIN